MAFTVYSAFITLTLIFQKWKINVMKYIMIEKSAECKSIVHDAADYTGVNILTTALDQYDAQSLLDYDLVVHAKKMGVLFNYTPIISSTVLNSCLIILLFVLMCLSVL